MTPEIVPKIVPEIVLVAARADNGVIGRNSALPWSLPADLRRFKALTKGAPMIMGRRTFESLGRLLPGRRHIVLTRDPSWTRESVEIARSPDEAIALAGGARVSVIGGAEIYALFLDRADRIELTEIHLAPDGDTVLPAFGAEWAEVAREGHPADGERPGYDFVTLIREEA